MTQEIYDLLLKVHAEQGRHSEHMNAIDSDIGALAHDVRKIDLALRGNGNPGALTRLSLLEDQIAALVPAATIERLEARLSEHCRGDAAANERTGNRLRFWGAITAAAIAACAGVAAAFVQLF